MTSKPAADVQMMPMSEAEARAAIVSIKGSLESAGRQALDLKRREGWKSLGYGSWQECAEKEFGESMRHIRRQMAVEEVLSFIRTDRSDELNENIPEYTIRPLTSLRDEPELIPQAWEAAKERAMERAKGKPTQEDVRRAIDAVLERNGLAAPRHEPLNDQRSFLDDRSPTDEKPKPSGYDVIMRRINEFWTLIASVSADNTPEQQGWGGFPAVAARMTAQERREIKNYLASLVVEIQEWLDQLEGL